MAVCCLSVNKVASDASYTVGEEIANAVTHGIAALLSIAGLAVLGRDVDAGHGDLHALGIGSEDLPLLALVLAGQDDDSIVFTNLHTSGLLK